MQMGKQDDLRAAPELEYARDLAAFISASPSSYHAACEVARRLETAGYLEQDEGQPWNAQPGGHYFVRDGAVMAWWVPRGASSSNAFRIVGSHTDSPGFKVKPTPGVEHHGFSQVNVETYGGLLRNSWLNRELGLAGRLVTIDGEEHLVRTDALMVIPQLAPHLDRSVNEKLVLNPQKHLHPFGARRETC